MIGVETPYHNDLTRILFIPSYLFSTIVLYLFVFYNFKGISFKDWIFDILCGYKQIEYYKESSIFIASARYSKNRLPHEETFSIHDIENESSSKEALIPLDYEINDEYMKNFKLNYTIKIS